MIRVTSEEAKALAREEGVDLVGVASADCVESPPYAVVHSEPERAHPGRCVRQISPYGLSRLITYLADSLDQPRDMIKQSFLNPDFWNLYQSLQVGLEYFCHDCINACPVGSSKPG